MWSCSVEHAASGDELAWRACGRVGFSGASPGM
jgi:hypothetical protein